MEENLYLNLSFLLPFFFVPFQTLIKVIFNITFVSALFNILFFKLHLWLGIPDIKMLPSIYTVLGGVFMYMMCYEVVFYTFHRILHHKLLYKHIHKTHHEWTASTTLVAAYNHPVDHILSNLVPIAIGSIVFRAHICVFWMWNAFLFLSTLTDHSGYHLPFLNSPEFHDYHHLK